MTKKNTTLNNGKRNGRTTKWDTRFSPTVTAFRIENTDGFSVSLAFYFIRKQDLEQLAEEIVSAGFCEKCRMSHNRLQLVNPDLLLIEYDDMYSLVNTILEDLDYEIDNDRLIF